MDHTNKSHILIVEEKNIFEASVYVCYEHEHCDNCPTHNHQINGVMDGPSGCLAVYESCLHVVPRLFYDDRFSKQCTIVVWEDFQQL